MKSGLYVIILLGAILVSCFGLVLAQDGHTLSLVLGPCWVMRVKDGDTITVRLPNDEPLEVRYLGINAPELSDKEHFGPQAKDANAALVGNRNVWLEVEKKKGGFRRGRDNRVLVYVFLDEARTQLVQQLLVSQGLARIDLRDVTDSALLTDRFTVRYADELIAAQIEAVKNRRGVWTLPDSFPDEDLAIAAIKFWGDKEAVYIVNRGRDTIELASGSTLLDESAYRSVQAEKEPKNELRFSSFFGPSCMLPPGGTLIIYSGPGIPPEMNGRVTGCGTKKVEAYWTRRKVWDNTGDTAYLLGPDRKLHSVYTYPPFQKKWAVSVDSSRVNGSGCSP